jgi:hypothetical protein
MRTLFFAALTLLTFKATAQNCACIQVLNTDNLSSVKVEQFSFIKDTALIEKTQRQTYIIQFCYANMGVAMMQSNVFIKQKYNAVIVERKKEQILSMTKLNNI